MNSEWKFCDGCGAIGESCCSKSRDRQELSSQLAQLVYRLTESNHLLKKENSELLARLGDTADVSTDSDYVWKVPTHGS